MSSEKKCKLCDSSIEDTYCSYCGFQNIGVIGSSAKKADEEARYELKKELLLNISEIGIVIYRYQSLKDDKPIFKKEFFSLLSSPIEIDKTSKSLSVYNGNKITLYKKCGQKIAELPPKTINISSNKESFDISASINENLKLDLFVKGETPEKIFKNIKLGETLILS